MNLESYLNSKYEFKYNEVLNRTFYKEKNKEENFKILKNYKFNSIKRELSNEGISTNISEVKSLLESDFVPKYNPFKEYFYALPEWNQNTDYISELAKKVKTTDDNLFHWAFKKWLVAMVVCSLDDKIPNHTMLILTGKQGTGKTTWLTNLISKELKAYVYSGNVNPNNKDSTLLMSERILINVDELVGLTRSQIEGFKELITKETISERRPYGYFTENYVRRASFTGSSNHNEILMDTSGNRRFLVFEIEEIDYLNQMDMDLVYSQVMTLIKTDFKYYFDAEDIKRIEENNKLYKQTTVEEEYLDKYFKVPSEASSDKCLKMNATEVIAYLKINIGYSVNFKAVEIGKLLKAKGYPDTKLKGIKKYILEPNN